MNSRKALISALCSLLLIAVALQAQPAARSIAIVLSTRGQAELQAHTADWEAAARGAILDDGHGVRTGEDGFLALLFTDDKSQLKIRPETQFVIQAARDSDHNLLKRINLEIGELLIDVQHRKGSLQVVTPTSVAAVKGTLFWASVDEDGNTTIQLIEGELEITNSVTGDILLIEAGQSAVVNEDGSVEISDLEETDLPEYTGDEEGPSTETIEIEFEDEEGNRKTLIIDIEGEE